MKPIVIWHHPKGHLQGLNVETGEEWLINFYKKQISQNKLWIFL